MNQTRSELIDHLYEQLAFIDSSCAQYDAGVHFEAKRLATHVRVLVHDAGSGTSLLTHLGIKNAVLFRDGADTAMLDLAQQHGMKGSIPGLAAVRLTNDGMAYVPAFLHKGLGESVLGFEKWWTSKRMMDIQGHTASRYDIVKWLCNTDGGAHVGQLHQTYKALSRDGSMGMTFRSAGGAPSSTDSPVPAAMRHIAEEIRTSIRALLPLAGESHTSGQ